MVMMMYEDVAVNDDDDDDADDYGDNYDDDDDDDEDVEMKIMIAMIKNDTKVVMDCKQGPKREPEDMRKNRNRNCFGDVA